MSSTDAKQVHSGMSWDERADLGELNAVLYANGSERKNLMIHASSLAGAEFAARLVGRLPAKEKVLLDFGCGTGRMLRFFGGKGVRVIGTEITAGMIEAAKRFGVPEGTELYLTDGVSIPVNDGAVDAIWVSGVLKYSLFPPGSPCRHGCALIPGAEGKEGTNGSVNLDPGAKAVFTPVYRDIAAEMYRVLKPGGIVVNVEMWVDSPPEVFTADFEQVGFVTKQARVLRRYLGLPERVCEWRDRIRLPRLCVIAAGKFCAKLRHRFDDPRRPGGGFRDYFFVWSKPARPDA